MKEISINLKRVNATHLFQHALLGLRAELKNSRNWKGDPVADVILCSGLNIKA